MIMTCRDGRRGGKYRDVYTCHAVRGRSVAELSAAVDPPCPDRAIILEPKCGWCPPRWRTCMTDRHPARGRSCWSSFRCRAGRCCYIPRPRPCRRSSAPGRVIVPAGDSRLPPRGRSPARAAVCRGAVAELAVAVASPGPDRAVALQRQAVWSPAGDATTPERPLT